MIDIRELTYTAILTTAIFILGWILFAENFSNRLVIVSLVSSSIASASLLTTFGLMPVLTGRHRGSDAAVLATVGFLFYSRLIVLLSSIAALTFALLDINQLSLAANWISAIIFLVSSFTRQAMRDVVTNAAVTQAPASKHSQWHASLVTLAATERRPGHRRLLDALAEQCKYSASDVPGANTDTDDRINAAISSLRPHASDLPEFELHCLEIAKMLHARDILITNYRSKV